MSDGQSEIHEQVAEFQRINLFTSDYHDRRQQIIHGIRFCETRIAELTIRLVVLQAELDLLKTP
jgi:hypothetical protein